jgi:hypothetical protein
MDAGEGQLFPGDRGRRRRWRSAVGLAAVADDFARVRVAPAGRRPERLEGDGPVLDLGHLAPGSGPAFDRRLDDVAGLDAVKPHLGFRL